MVIPVSPSTCLSSYLSVVPVLPACGHTCLSSYLSVLLPVCPPTCLLYQCHQPVVLPVCAAAVAVAVAGVQSTVRAQKAHGAPPVTTATPVDITVDAHHRLAVRVVLMDRDDGTVGITSIKCWASAIPSHHRRPSLASAPQPAMGALASLAKLVSKVLLLGSQLGQFRACSFTT